VFVVDDDVSVRESLELLIRFAGWQPETFASAQEFADHLHHRARRCPDDRPGHEGGGG
jgi:FixJ family two-component response regulator